MERRTPAYPNFNYPNGNVSVHIAL